MHYVVFATGLSFDSQEFECTAYGREFGCASQIRICWVYFYYYLWGWYHCNCYLRRYHHPHDWKTNILTVNGGDGSHILIGSRISILSARGLVESESCSCLPLRREMRCDTMIVLWWIIVVVETRILKGERSLQCSSFSTLLPSCDDVSSSNLSLLVEWLSSSITLQLTNSFLSNLTACAMQNFSCRICSRHLLSIVINSFVDRRRARILPLSLFKELLPRVHHLDSSPPS